jgi:Mobilization protein NikA
MADESMFEQIAKDRQHYLEHPSDEDEWEPAPPPARKKRRRALTSMLSVRLPAFEVDKIRSAAEAEGLTISAFIRAAALDRAQAGKNGINLSASCGNFNNVVRSVTFASGVPLSGGLQPGLQTCSALVDCQPLASTHPFLVSG